MLRPRLTQELHFGLMDDGFVDMEPSGIIGPFLRRLADSLSTGDRCWLRLSQPLRWRSPETRRIDCGGHIVALGLPRNPASPPTTPGRIAVETLFDVVTIWDLDSRRQIQQRTGTLHAMNAEWETIWHNREQGEDKSRFVGVGLGSEPLEVTGFRSTPNSPISAGVCPKQGHLVVIRPAGPDGEKDVFVFTEGVTAVRWLPVGSWLLSIHRDGRLMAWDMERLPKQADEEGHRSAFEFVSWSPDGETTCLRARHEDLALWKTDGTFERIPFNDATGVWGWTANHFWIGDGAGKVRISLIDSEQGGTTSWIEEGERCDAIAFDSTTGRLAIGIRQSGRAHLSVWRSARPGRLPWTRRPSLRRLWSRDQGLCSIGALAWQPGVEDPLLAALNEGRLLLLDGDSGRVIKELPASRLVFETPLIRLFGATIVAHEAIPKGDCMAYIPSFDVLAWHPNGRWLAGVSIWGNLAVWDTETGKSEFSWQVEERGDFAFFAIAWIPSTRWLATGSADGWLRIWNGMTGECIAGCHCGGPVKAIWCHPDEKGNLRTLVEMSSGRRFSPLVLNFSLESV